MNEPHQRVAGPSPFLPSTTLQFAWDSTSLGVFKECARKYYYSMVLGYRPHGLSIHLKFGLIVHSALELYDRVKAERGEAFDHEEAVDKVVDHVLTETWDREAERPWDSEDSYKNRHTLLRTVIWYLEAYKDDPAQTIILANGKPAVELTFKLSLGMWVPGGGQDYLFTGHMDRVVEYCGGQYVMDRKTSKSELNARYFKGYSPDNQMSAYSLASNIIYDAPVQGVIIDGMHIQVGATNFARGFTLRTEAQLEEWLVETQGWIRLAEHYAEKHFYPMNDKSCHNYGGCPFREVCSKDPRVRQNFLDTNFKIERWNPLDER